MTAILSLQLDFSEIHPVAFHSQTFTPPELNHDKELLAIFKAFHVWWHYFEGSGISIDVLTDHKNLENFSTTRFSSIDRPIGPNISHSSTSSFAFALGN